MLIFSTLGHKVVKLHLIREHSHVLAHDLSGTEHSSRCQKLAQT
jgi:hypothetical protein